MTDNHYNNQERQAPADTLRDSNIKATIWRNESEKGSYYSTKLSKTYQDRDGNYRDTGSFSQNDLLRVSELARSAYNRVGELRREGREHSHEQSPEPAPSPDKQRFMEQRQAKQAKPTKGKKPFYSR